MQRFAPKSILTSIIDDWAPYYVERSIAARDGTWKQHDTWHGLKEGMVAMAPYNSAMGSDLIKEVEQLQNKIAQKLGYKLVDHKLELYRSKIKKN